MARCTLATVSGSTTMIQDQTKSICDTVTASGEAVVISASAQTVRGAIALVASVRHAAIFIRM